jgi:hypothetical protein
VLVADESVVPAARTGKAVLISPPEDTRVMINEAACEGAVVAWRVVSCRAVNAVIMNGTNLTALISMQSMNPSAFFSPCNDEIHTRVRSKAQKGPGVRWRLRLLYPLLEVEDLGPVLFEPSLLVAAHQTFLALLLQIAVELVRSRNRHRHNTKQRGVSVVRGRTVRRREASAHACVGYLLRCAQLKCKKEKENMAKLNIKKSIKQNKLDLLNPKIFYIEEVDAVPLPVHHDNSKERSLRTGRGAVATTFSIL